MQVENTSYAFLPISRSTHFTLGMVRAIQIEYTAGKQYICISGEPHKLTL
uniref:AlNc14C47G3802 protein n=1 Tax=Albugo laibachii Nc14 TaxID=890382 RepID=F0WAU0_9STRA|nr:AlNc14C47G3802 [Albugo laibachii Nc14]|eukprot:CCA18262.1 AlNc14C47G3802 [Albugo laibachii Nc14]